MALFNMVWQMEMLQMNAVDGRTARLIQEDRANRRLGNDKSRPTDGCVRYLVPGKDGEQVNCLVYTAPYHVYSGTGGKWIFLKLLYVILALAGFVSTLLMLMQPGVFRTAKLVDAAGVFALMVFVYFLYAAFFQVVTPRRMTLYQYRKGVRRFRGALIAVTVMTVLSLAAAGGYALAAHVTLQGGDAARMTFTALSAVCTVAMLVLEFMRKCPEIPNDDPLPEGAVQV